MLPNANEPPRNAPRARSAKLPAFGPPQTTWSRDAFKNGLSIHLLPEKSLLVRLLQIHLSPYSGPWQRGADTLRGAEILQGVRRERHGQFH